MTTQTQEWYRAICAEYGVLTERQIALQVMKKSRFQAARSPFRVSRMRLQKNKLGLGYFVRKAFNWNFRTYFWYLCLLVDVVTGDSLDLGATGSKYKLKKMGEGQQIH